jgi:hypothetical protein
MMNATSVCVTQHLSITNGGLAQERLNLMEYSPAKLGFQVGISSITVMTNWHLGRENGKCTWWIKPGELISVPDVWS